MFNANEWHLGILKWSDRMKDTITGLRGSWFYIGDNGNSTSTAGVDGGVTLIRIKNVPDGVAKPDTLLLQIDGGKPAGENLPETAYFGVASHNMGRVMVVAEYEKSLITPVTASKASVATPKSKS